jgi:hypothetical protein
MVALVPLRALAAVSGSLCAEYGGAAAASLGAHHHAHASASDEMSPQGDAGDAAPACSLCTACCTGVSFVAEGASPLVLAGAHPAPIPLVERRPASPHPDELDRPPLSR